jgi:20S proteasome alpha/beta subunit
MVLSSSTSEKDSWRTATASGSENCVQVKSKDGMVIVGNSRQTDGPFLSYTRDEWVAFLDGAKKGEFDDLL